jgi:hypothetical protein
VTLSERRVYAKRSPKGTTTTRGLRAVTIIIVKVVHVVADNLLMACRF